MSQFTPAIRAITPTDEPDRLAGGVLNSLTRPIYRRFSWGPLRAVLATGFTLGLLPLLKMMGWMRAIVPLQQQQLWYLAEWIRVQGGDPDAADLQRVSEKIRLSTVMMLGTGVFLAAAVGAIAMHFALVPFNVRALYRFAFHVPQTPPQILFTLAICAAAVCQWMHLAWHQQNVERYVRWFNHLVSRQGLDEVPLPKLELGLNPSWIVGGIALAVLGGALWAIPVMLAAGAHRRYIIETSVRTRAMLAERLRAMLAQRRPAMKLPAPLIAIRTCVRPNCRSPLPSAAAFCPRCGTPAARRMNVVA